MNKEFHWFENSDDIGRAIWDITNPLSLGSVGTDFYSTNKFLHDDRPLILSTQSYFFSQYTIDCGYALFAHFADGAVIHVYRGMTTEGGRLIGAGQNLEKLLLSGEFHIE